MQSRQWHDTRLKVLERDIICQDCKQLGKVTPIDEVHHIRPLETFHDNAAFFRAAYDLTNLVGLCRDCHHLRHEQLGSQTRKERKEREQQSINHFMNEYL